MNKQLYRTYLILVSLAGLAIVVWALLTLPPVDPTLLLLLLALNAAAQSAAAVSVRGGITFGVGSAVNLAAVALFGVQAGVLVAVVANIALWLALSYTGEGNWRGSIEQLPFNLGIESIYVAVSGALLLWLLQNVEWALVAWIAAAVVNDQLNMWLLYVMVRLQHGVDPLTFFNKNRQAIPINLTILAFGGLLLTNATVALGWQGIVLFLFPLLLAAYSFRLYVRETDRQMKLVNERTDQLAAANQQLKQLALNKDRMLAVLSHDMRTSLSAIRASSHVLVESGHMLPREKQKHMLGLIVQSEQMLTSMVNNILKIEQVKQDSPPQLDLSFFNLSELVENVVGSMETLAQHKDLRLRFYSDSDPIFITADRQMMQQVVLNLVSNGIKYSEQGQSVFVSLELSGDDAILEVEDTGFGIKADDLPQVFDPYFRSPAHEAVATGTGLGLAIVKRFVEAHEGEVDVSSEVDKGSRFSVRLPLQTEQRHPNAALPAVTPSRPDIVA